MNGVNFSKIKELNLPEIRQFGYVVKDIDTAVSDFSNLFKIKPWFRAKFAEQTVYYQDKEIDIEIDTAIAFDGKLEYQLIEVKSGQDNIYTDFINQQGEGLHHLGIFVTDIDLRLRQLREKGVNAAQSGTMKSKGGAITKFAYLDTEDSCGIILELVETKYLGFNMGVSKFLLNVGNLTGDVSKIRTHSERITP